MACRDSASTVVPPLGRVGRLATVQPLSQRMSWPRALLNRRMPAIGTVKSQFPPWRETICSACPAQPAVGVFPISQLWPSAGVAGGVSASPSTARNSRASILAAISLTKPSFWVWPAGVAVLRPAQRFRFSGRIERRLGSVAPGQAAQRWFKHRDLPGRTGGENAAFAFDHDRADFGQRGADQGKARLGPRLADPADPFGPGPGLAKAAPGQDQPGRPVAGRRQLAFARPELPVITQFAPLFLAQLPQGTQPGRFVKVEQGIEQPMVRHRCPGRWEPARWPPRVADALLQAWR